MADLKTPEINTADETPKASEDAETRQVAGANDPPRKPLTRTSAVGQGAVIIFIGLAHAMGGVGATTLLAPFMQADLKISDSNLQWVSSSLTIPVGSLFLVSGRLSDLLGGKRCCLFGTALFALGVLITGFLHSDIAVYAIRGLSGVGNVIGMTSAYTMIEYIYPAGPTRSLVFALYIAGFPTGAGLATVIAGFSSADNWRIFFFIHAGILGACFLAVLLILPEYHRPYVNIVSQIDFLGSGLIMISLVMLFYVLSAAPDASKGWGTPYIVVLLILSFVVMGLFILWQRFLLKRNRVPLLRLSLFLADRGGVATVFIVAITCFSGYSGYMFLSNLYFQKYLHLSIKHTAIGYLPGPIAGILCSVLVGFIAGKTPVHWLLAGGAAATGISLVLLAVAPVNASYWGYTFVAMALSVVGPDGMGSAGGIYVSTLAVRDYGMAAGLLQTFVQLGSGLGPSVGTIIHRYAAQSDARKNGFFATIDDPDFPPSSYLHGLRMGYWGIAAMCLFGAILCPAVMWRRKSSAKIGPDEASSFAAPDLEQDIGLEKGAVAEYTYTERESARKA